jgi:hypothetical protein
MPKQALFLMRLVRSITTGTPLAASKYRGALRQERNARSTRPAFNRNEDMTMKHRKGPSQQAASNHPVNPQQPNRDGGQQQQNQKPPPHQGGQRQP